MIYVTKPTAKAKAAEAALKQAIKKLGKGFDPEVVVAIGGDGTMLHAIRQNLDAGLPFVGISAGRLGFLQTVETNQIPQLAKALQKRTYHQIKAPLLAAKAGAKVLGYAFNDISVERASARAARFKLHINDSVGSFVGDGVIFATPLGSTAYNLAAAGPIIDSTVQDVFVVTPNNPHFSPLYSSLQRPHVLNRHRRIVVKVDAQDAKERPVKLVVDGHTFEVDLNNLEVYLSDKTVNLIELTPDGFHRRIENMRLGRS